MSFHHWIFSFCALVLFSQNADALIVFDSTSSTDNTKNVIDPANSATYPTGEALGVPWQYLICYGQGNASGVYIGNGYLLTAWHVTDADAGTPLQINGTTHTRDMSFASVPIVFPAEHGGHVVDLKVQRLATDPSLATLPILPSATEDLSSPVVACAWGEGKGTLVENQGWYWGSGTRAFRWGTNTTYPIVSPATYDIGAGVPMNYETLPTTFETNKGSSEFQCTMGDSGSGLFQKSGSTWYLSGITTTVSVNGSAFYDRDLGTFGNQGDSSFFVRLKNYAWVLRFDHWKAYYGVSAQTSSSDSDGDGVPLLLEYAFGMDPTQNSTARHPACSIESDSLTITYGRLASTTDLQLIFEVSDSLAADSWVSVSPTITRTDTASVFQTHKASIPLDGVEKKFARIRAFLLP